MAWDVVEIVESVADHLRARARADDVEQAVYSIDALEELQLHPLIQQGLRAAGFGVWPEQRYPGDRMSRRRSEGRRCDIVLTPDGLPLAEPDAEATLFADERAVPLAAAFWLEIKAVSQYYPGGPSGPGGYSGKLMQPPASDIRKLAGDHLLYHAGVMIVLFTADAQIARHDLAVWERRALDKGYGVAPPILRMFQINDRLGNGCCSVALFPVRRL
jgi:hypothetical protein